MCMGNASWRPKEALTMGLGNAKAMGKAALLPTKKNLMASHKGQQRMVSNLFTDRSGRKEAEAKYKQTNQNTILAGNTQVQADDQRRAKAYAGKSRAFGVLDSDKTILGG